MVRVGDSLRRVIEERAGDRCEYCCAPRSIVGAAFHVEHILPSARGGGDGPDNLALSCSSCNLANGVATTARDPATGGRVALYNPRTQDWTDHFALAEDGVTILGTTATGRATTQRLAMNGPRRLVALEYWRRVGLYP